MAAIGGTIAKTTEIAQVLPRSLSAGQIAAISISIAVVVIGGFAAYACHAERDSSNDYDDDDDTRMRRLRRWLARKIRDVEGMVRRRRAVPSDDLAEKKLESDSDGESEIEKKPGAGVETEGSGLAGIQVWPWDERYLPPGRQGAQQ